MKCLIFNDILLNENNVSQFQNSLNFVSKNPVNNKLTLVQVMNGLPLNRRAITRANVEPVLTTLSQLQNTASKIDKTPLDN